MKYFYFFFIATTFLSFHSFNYCHYRLNEKQVTLGTVIIKKTTVELCINLKNTPFMTHTILNVFQLTEWYTDVFAKPFILLYWVECHIRGEHHCLASKLDYQCLRCATFYETHYSFKLLLYHQNSYCNY